MGVCYCYHMVLFLLSWGDLKGQEWELVWSDEFDGDSINFTNWDHEITHRGGGNSEFQVYTPDPVNSFVRDGYLYLRPTMLEENINPLTEKPFGQDFLYEGTMNLTELYGRCTDRDNNGCVRQGYAPPTNTEIPPVASARLRSFERFSFRFGKVEVMAKMPMGDWLWPAIWLLPERMCYGHWPTSGELDLVETVGNEDFYYEDGEAAGIQKMKSTIHWGVNRHENRFHLTHNHHINETNNYGNSFHLYEMIWAPDGFSFFIDGIRLLDVPETDTPNWKGFFEFGKPWETIDEDDPKQNPWGNNSFPRVAPFDTEFHFLLNVAVGGTNNYISDVAINRGGDPAYAKPWPNGMTQVEAMNLFYKARGEDKTSGWLWTWLKERADNDNDAMKVDYVRVYKHSDLPPEQTPDCP